MSRKKTIEQINNITAETMDALNPLYAEYDRISTALITNHKEFPRASRFDVAESKEYAGLAAANVILRDANTKIDDKFVNSHADDPDIRKRYEESLKKSKEITEDYPEVNNRLPLIISFLVIGLAFVAAYILGNIIKIIDIPLDPNIANVIWIVVIGVGAVFVLLGALFGIFYIVNMSAMYSDLKDRLHEAKMLRKNNNALMEEIEGRLTNLDNALKASIIAEDAAFDQIRAIPDTGEVLFSIKECIGGAVTLIYQKRAHNLAEAFNVIENSIRVNEISDILLAQHKVLAAIVKELRIQNKVAIASFSDSDLEL